MLKREDVVIMNNLPVQKVAAVREAIEAAGAMPNPAAMAFSKFKALLRTAAERTIPGRSPAQDGAHRQVLQSDRMQELPAPRRLCSNMIGIRSPRLARQRTRPRDAMAQICLEKVISTRRFSTPPV
jgi:hypothetical protein